MLEHMDIDMLSFTGSTAVGKNCVQAAVQFQKLGLELGGKNPQIVFADADLEDAADGVALVLHSTRAVLCIRFAIACRTLGRRPVCGASERQIL